MTSHAVNPLALLWFQGKMAASGQDGGVAFLHLPLNVYSPGLQELRSPRASLHVLGVRVWACV